MSHQIGAKSCTLSFHKTVFTPRIKQATDIHTAKEMMAIFAALRTRVTAKRGIRAKINPKKFAIGTRGYMRSMAEKTRIRRGFIHGIYLSVRESQVGLAGISHRTRGWKVMGTYIDLRSKVARTRALGIHVCSKYGLSLISQWPGKLNEKDGAFYEHEGEAMFLLVKTVRMSDHDDDGAGGRGWDWSRETGIKAVY